ncbi:unnamed protein product, partial [Amoebophrya sp. A25]
ISVLVYYKYYVVLRTTKNKNGNDKVDYLVIQFSSDIAHFHRIAIAYFFVGPGHSFCDYHVAYC